jgi:hypothetical protein
VQLVGPLVDDLDAHVLQHRQHLGQRDALAGQVQLEAALPRFGVGAAVEGDVEVALVLQPFEAAQVGERVDRGEVLLVRLGEHAREPQALLGGGLGADRDQLVAGARRAGVDLVPLLGEHGLDEPVVPRADGLGEPVLDAVDVRVDGRTVRVGVHGEVDLRERGLADAGGELDVGAAELVDEDVLHRDARGGGVPVAGREHQAGEEPAVRVAAQEQAEAAAVGERDDAGGRLVQRVRAGGEQLGARPVLDDLEHLLPGVGLQREAGAVDDLEDSSADDRDVQDVLVQRVDGEDAEEPVLAGDRAVLGEGLDADVVRERRPVDAGRRGRLGEDQQVG